METDRKENIYTKTTFIKDESGKIIDLSSEEFKKESNIDSLKTFTYKSNALWFKQYRNHFPKFKNKSFDKYFTKMINLMSFSNCISLRQKYQNNSINEVLSKVFECNEITLRRFIAEARQLGAIASTSYKNTKCYFINPFYAHYGFKFPIILFELFKTDINFLKSFKLDDKKLFLSNYNIDIDDMIKKIEYDKKETTEKEPNEYEKYFSRINYEEDYE